MSSEDAQKQALALFQQGRLSPEGLASVMWVCGERAEQIGAPNALDIARELGVLSEPEQKTAVLEVDEPATQQSLDLPEFLRAQASPSPSPSPAASSSGASGSTGSGGGKPWQESKAEERSRISAELPRTVVRAVQGDSGVMPAVEIGEEAPEPTQTPLGEFCTLSGIRPAAVSPGLSEDDPPLAAPGEPRYALGGKLGEGGVGQVFLGVDRDLRRSVALKVLHPQNRADAIQLQAFIEEAIITGGLEHPNIVPLYELGWSEQVGPYYAMKRMRGYPLSQELRLLRRGDAEAEARSGVFRLLSHFLEACQAVAYAHRHGVVHCDLKPANIMIGDFGEVLVVDWGLAKVMGRRGLGQARANFWSGTPAYMPPEQATGTLKDLDPQSDVWALGAILYEILTLTVPFPARTSEETLLKLVREAVEPPSRRAPERRIPPVLEQITMRALEKDKALRYGGVEELIDDLQDYLEGTRERRRLQELAEQAVDDAREALRRVSAVESEVDAQQLEILRPELELEVRDAKIEELSESRDALVFAYGDAAQALERGLEALPEHAESMALVGELYWHIFTRLYPARVPARERVREQGMALLARLSQLSLPSVVQAARRMGSSVMPALNAVSAEVVEDPWLGAVLSFFGPELALDAMQDGTPGAMAPLIRRIAFLKGVPLFATLNGSALLPIADVCEELAFPSGHVIFEQGDFGDALFVVLEGRVEVVRDGAVLTTLGARDCFGEIAVLDASTRTASVRCTESVRCLMLTAPRFREIVVNNGAIGLAVMRVLTGRLRTATEREAELRSSLDAT